MPRHSKGPSIAPALGAVAACFAVLILAWTGLSQTGEHGSAEWSAARNVRPRGDGPLPAASGGDTARSPAPAEAPSDRHGRLRYSLLPLPPEAGGGFTLGIGIDEETPQFPETAAIRAVSGHGLDPDSWNRIRTLSRLESLEHDGDATNADLACLAAFPGLEVLRLASAVHRSGPTLWPDRRPPFSAAALKPLGQMKPLRELSLASDFLGDEGMDVLATAPGLLSLKLDGPFTNKTLRHIGELRGLQRLFLAGDFDDDGMRLLTRLRNLEMLELRSKHLRGPGLAHLASLPRLRSLRIAQAAPELSLSGLARCPTLEVLDLGSAGITDDILETLPPLPHLQSLSIDENLIGDPGLNALTRLPQLAELNLRRTRITDAGLETIGNHEPFQRHLRILCLGERNVYGSPPVMTQSGLAHLSRLRELEALDLRYVDLVGVDLQVLALPSLRRLNASGLMPDPRNETLQGLFRRLPRLSRDVDARIAIRADLCREAEILQYDFLSDRLKVALSMPRHP